MRHFQSGPYLSLSASFGQQVSQRFLEDEGRYNYTTPKSFLELIGFYKDLLRRKQGELGRNITRLANGLQTLRTTNEDVQVPNRAFHIEIRVLTGRETFSCFGNDIVS